MWFLTHHFPSPFSDHPFGKKNWARSAHNVHRKNNINALLSSPFEHATSRSNTNTSLFTLWLHQRTIPSSAQHPFCVFHASPNLTYTQVSRNKILANLHFCSIRNRHHSLKIVPIIFHVRTQKAFLQNQLHNTTKKFSFSTTSTVIQERFWQKSF